MSGQQGSEKGPWNKCQLGWDWKIGETDRTDDGGDLH